MFIHVKISITNSFCPVGGSSTTAWSGEQGISLLSIQLIAWVIVVGFLGVQNSCSSVLDDGC